MKTMTMNVMFALICMLSLATMGCPEVGPVCITEEEAYGPDVGSLDDVGDGSTDDGTTFPELAPVKKIEFNPTVEGPDLLL